MKNQKWDEGKVNIVLACTLLTFLVSLPLFTDFLLLGTDLQYQLLRIEALKDGLKEAGILLWAKPNWIEPSGFSFAFFYGDTFLYIPALLRLAGVDVQMSWRIFLVLINGATAFGSFAAFRKIFGEDRAGLVCSALYTMSVYRIFLLYAEAELGEILALVFVPFALAGAVLILREEQEKEKSGWLWLCVGLSGILRSHMLSFGITVLFLLIMTAIYGIRLRGAALWKQAFLGIAAFLLWNLNYIYAVIQYIRVGGFVINPFSGVPIQGRGVQPVQLFMAFYQAGGNYEFGAQGVGGAAPVGLGLVFLAAALVFCYFMFVCGEDFGKEEKKRGYTALGLGLFSCLLGSLCFPWDSVLKWSDLTSSLVSMIRSPWHFLQAGLLAFSMLGGITCQMVEKKCGDFCGKIYGIGLAGTGCFCASYLVANLLFYSDFVRIQEAEQLWVPMAEEGEEAMLPVLASGLQVNGADGIWYVLTAVGIAAVSACAAAVWKRRRGEKQGGDGER